MFFFKKEEIRQIIIDEKKKMLMNECGQRRKCILKLAPTINQSKSKSISHSVSQSEYDGHSNHLNYHHDCCCCCYYSLSLIYSNINNFPIVIRNFILKRIFPCCCCCFISLQLQIRYSTTTTTMMMENKIGRPILKLKISVDTPFTFINDFFFFSRHLCMCLH